MPLTLDQQKDDFVTDIARDRSAWFWLMVPQIILLFSASAGLAGIAGFGLYTSVVVFREKADADLLTKGAAVFVAGSSSVLGFFVTRMMAKVLEFIREYDAVARDYAK